MKNKLFLRGQVVDEATFLHEFNEEKFYQFSMRTDFLENFPVRIPERLQKSGKIEKGKEICLYGDLQSYFDRESGKIRLFCLGDMIGVNPVGDRNFHVLHGHICKKPVYYTVDNAERVSFLLSVERTANISDYIPCVAEGKDVEIIKKIKLGERLVVIGTLQDEKEAQKPLKTVFKTKRIARCGLGYLSETFSLLQEEQKNRQLYDTNPRCDIFQILCDVNPKIKYNPKEIKIRVSEDSFEDTFKAIVFYLAEDYEGNDFVETSYLDFVNTVRKKHICIAYQGDGNCMFNTDSIVDLYDIDR